MRTASSRVILPIGLIAVIVLAFGGCDVIVVFSGDSNADANLSIQLTWEDEDTDLDLYVTLPEPADDDYTVETGEVPPYNSIQDAYGEFLGGRLGFFPEDGREYRDEVYEDNPESNYNGEVVYDKASETTEVIQILDVPFDYDTLYESDYTTTPNEDNALPSGHEYAWIGVMEVYVWAQRGEVSTAGNPVVTVYDENDREIGWYPINEDTYIKGASVIRIPVFRTTNSDRRNYYQLLLDKRLINTTNDIRSIAAENQDYIVAGTSASSR
ncbi:MAG: hypothetical protein ACOCXN_06280 [Spirochaetota bacterium]